MPSAQAISDIDDPQARVTTWTFAAAGDTTGQHVHEYDYLVVPVTGGTFTVTAPDGTTAVMIQHAGLPYRGSAGTEHAVSNVPGTRTVFVEIELKR